MKKVCEELHRYFNSLERFMFPYNEMHIPQNGIYVFFEKGEYGHGLDRIVRIGTHTGDNKLKSRLKEHFTIENKDRSIFRKNIGRAILNKARDEYLPIWDIDFTAREQKDKYSSLIKKEYQECIENQVTRYIQDNFSFCVIEVLNKDERLSLESKLIASISQCSACGSSKGWLGNYSPKEAIKARGLWQVNNLNKEPLTMEELDVFLEKNKRN